MYWVFPVSVLSLWVLYCFVLKRKQKEAFKLSIHILPLMIVSICSNISLGINYIINNLSDSGVPNFSDGRNIYGLISNLMFRNIMGEGVWDRIAFSRVFNISCFVTFALFCYLIIFNIYEVYGSKKV